MDEEHSTCLLILARFPHLRQRSRSPPTGRQLFRAGRPQHTTRCTTRLLDRFTMPYCRTNSVLSTHVWPAARSNFSSIYRLSKSKCLPGWTGPRPIQDNHFRVPFKFEKLNSNHVSHWSRWLSSLLVDAPDCACGLVAPLKTERLVMKLTKSSLWRWTTDLDMGFSHKQGVEVSIHIICSSACSICITHFRANGGKGPKRP